MTKYEVGTEPVKGRSVRTKTRKEVAAPEAAKKRAARKAPAKKKAAAK